MASRQLASLNSTEDSTICQSTPVRTYMHFGLTNCVRSNSNVRLYRIDEKNSSFLRENKIYDTPQLDQKLVSSRYWTAGECLRIR